MKKKMWIYIVVALLVLAAVIAVVIRNHGTADPAAEGEQTETEEAGEGSASPADQTGAEEGTDGSGTSAGTEIADDQGESGESVVITIPDDMEVGGEGLD